MTKRGGRLLKERAIVKGEGVVSMRQQPPCPFMAATDEDENVSVP
jgi:hypothetical protein